MSIGVSHFSLLCCRDFSSLSRDNSYQNNQLVSPFFPRAFTPVRCFQGSFSSRLRFQTLKVNLCDLFCLQILLRRRSRPRRSWASLHYSTQKTWLPLRCRTLWGSSPTFPGTTASSAGCLVVCSSPSDAFIYIDLRCNSIVV